MPLIAGAVVLAGMIPSIIMLVVAKDLRIAKVDDRPYVVSSGIDADRRALATLRAGNFRFDTEVHGTAVIARMSGTLPEHPRVVLQRPDDALADHVIVWTDPTHSLMILPGRLGRWNIRLEGIVEGVNARLIETTIDLTAEPHALPDR